jgi:hypothetical protein
MRPEQPSFKAQRCISFEKIAEGGVRQPSVFLSLTNAQGHDLTGYIYCERFDNKSEAIARMPCQVASNTYIITASEVASVDFTGIVVPSRWI